LLERGIDRKTHDTNIAEMRRNEGATERSRNGENRSRSDGKRRTKNIVSSILTLRNVSR